MSANLAGNLTASAGAALLKATGDISAKAVDVSGDTVNVQNVASTNGTLDVTANNGELRLVGASNTGGIGRVRKLGGIDDLVATGTLNVTTVSSNTNVRAQRIAGIGTVTATSTTAGQGMITGVVATDGVDLGGTFSSFDLTLRAGNGIIIAGKATGDSGIDATTTQGNISVLGALGSPVTANARLHSARLIANAGTVSTQAIYTTADTAAGFSTGGITLSGLTLQAGVLSSVTGAAPTGAPTIALTGDAITLSGLATATGVTTDITVNRLSAGSTTASFGGVGLQAGRDVLIGQTQNFATLTLSGISSGGRNFTSDTTGDSALGSASAVTALDAASTTGAVTYAALSGAGSKTLDAATTISGTSIAGAGAVVLTRATTISPGTIGTAPAPVAALTVNGGALTLGATFVTGAAQLGQGTGLTSVTANGAVSAGNLAATTSGAQTYGATVTTTAQTAITSTNGLVTTTGLVNAGTNTGAANRSLSIIAKSVSAGPLQAGTGITVTGNGTVAGLRDVTVAGADAGTSVVIAADTAASTTISGNVTARGGDYTVSGGTVSLTGGAQQATGATTVNAGIVNASAGVVVTANSDNAGGDLLTVGDTTTTAFNLTGSTLRGNADGNGVVRFASAAATTPFAIGNVFAATVQQKIGVGAAADINRTGDISFGNLTLSGVNTITASGSLQTGALTVGNGAPALTLNAGTAATVTGVIANLAGNTGGVTVNGATVSANGSTLTGALILAATSTTAGQGVTYTTLGGSGSKTLNAAQSISGGAITGAGAVTLNPGAAGTVSITGAIGTVVTPVASLTVARGGTVGLLGAFVTGATSLGQTAEITGLTVGGTLDTGSLVSDSTGGSSFQAVRARTGNIDVASSAGALGFGGTVDGPGTLVVQAAAVSGTTFSGAVGGIQAFTSFTSLGTGRVFLNGGSLTTATGPTGTQTYGGQLVLGADTVLTGGTATFTGGVPGNDGVRDHDLALNFTQAQTLTGATFTGIRNLSTDAGGGTTIASDITTSGGQNYGDTVTLNPAGAGVVLTSTGAGAVTFAGLVGNGKNLTVTTSGTTTFTLGASGYVDLTTNGGGATVLNGTMAGTGAQVFNDNVVLGSATTITGGAGAVTFGGTVIGANSLIVTTGGLTTFGGAVGPIASLTSNGAGAIRVNGGSIATTGNQNYTGQVQLGANTVLSTNGANTVVNFGATGVNGFTGGTNFDLAVNTSGAQTLGSTIAGVRNLSTDAAGTLTLAGGITTTGSQSYGENVTLGGPTTLTAGTTIGFAGTVDGVQTLNTNATTTTFNADVGQTAALDVADGERARRRPPARGTRRDHAPTGVADVQQRAGAWPRYAADRDRPVYLHRRRQWLCRAISG